MFPVLTHCRSIKRSLGLLLTVIIHIVLGLLLTSAVVAQSSDQYTGSPAFVTSVKGQFDSVSLPYGDVLVDFPIRSKTGKYPLTLSLVGNSHMYIGAPSISNFFIGQWLSTYGIFGRASGSQFSSALNTGANFTGTTTNCQGGAENVYQNFTVAETNGTHHPFQPGLAVQSGPCGNTSFLATTTDNSGYTMQVQGANGGAQVTLWDKSGNLLESQSQVGSITDPDNVSMTGSLSSSGSFVDTLGQNVVTSTVTLGSAGDTYAYNDISQNQQIVKVNYTRLPQVTAFACNDIQEIVPNYVYFPTSIAYPDGETVGIGYEQQSLSTLPAWRASYFYSFLTGHNCLAVMDTNGNLEGVKTFGTSGTSQPAWNPTVGGQTTDGTVVWQNYGKTWTSGRIGSISYPEGGSVTYAYSGMIIATEGQNTYVAWPAQITRTVNDNNGNISSWIYQISAPSANNGTVTVTETDPTNNVTMLYFAGATQTGSGVPANCISGYLSGCAYTYVQTAQMSYNGTAVASHLIGKQVTCYNLHNSTESTCVTPTVPITFPIQNTDNYSHAVGSLGAIGSANDIETGYDAYGNVTSITKYDYGAFPHSGTSLSTTTTVYNTGSTCGTLSISAMKDRPCSITVSGPSGGSQVKYTYNAAGHPITTATLVSGTTYLNSSATFNATGTIASSTDVNTAPTSYHYDGTGGCSNLLLTSTVLPGGLTTSQTWDCNGGVLTSTTDANSQITQYGYFDQNGVADPMWRRRSTTDPLTPPNITWNSFNTTSLPFTEESAVTFNGSASTVDTLTTFDGLGRPIVSQKRQAPLSSSFDTVSTTYDIDGRVASVSAPCTKTVSQPCPATPATTTTYDGLSRPQLVTDAGGGTTSYSYLLNDVSVTTGPAPTSQRQMEYDGAGRLTSVCEVTANTLWPGGNCAQNTPLTGYWTKYSYDALGNLTSVSENAQGSTIQTRSYIYDGLSRLTSESNPEWNSASASYTYDTVSSGNCSGTYNGDLVKKVDPAGNVTCSVFDQLHRATSITYPSGPNSAATPPKTFVYDSATVNSKAMLLAKGRLAEAYTGSKATDLGFSYDAGGRIIDFYESTPHSSGYYDITASYWENNVLETLKGVSLPTLTYGVDGEGRLNTVSASAGVSPVSATTYNPSGQATDVTFGSTDPVHFAFDSMGRMTQYKLTINGTATHGDPAWNPNGTLGSLAITDPFNTSDAQTCNYSYDDMVRLAGVDCGAAIWQQNFTYDPFGNITKTVPTGSAGLQFQPGYNESNNHYTDGATYDANGNLTNDGTDHIYTWDSDGHPVTLDSDTLLFDALGREVEVFKSGAYTEFVFGPTGKLALMTGQTQTKAFVALPGGTQVKYAGSAISTYRLPDWLGSFRVGSNPNRTYSWGVAFAPFGEMYAQSGGPAWSFTGEEGTADTVSDEYDFLARELHSSQGRWISPDPAGLSAADPMNPQSWNLYAYVTNEPLDATDPLGLFKLNPCRPGHSADPGCPDAPDWWSLAEEGGTSWAQVCLSQGICHTDTEKPKPPRLMRRKQLTPDQCKAAQTLLAREQQFGTTRAAWMSAIGYGDGTIQPFNSTNTAPTQTPQGPIKVDWFTDLKLLGPTGAQYEMYPITKVAWSLERKSLGAPITNFWPWQDPAETNAWGLSMQPQSGFSSIFTPQFMQANCGTGQSGTQSGGG